MQPFINLLKEHQSQGAVTHVDETPVQVLKEIGTSSNIRVIVKWCRWSINSRLRLNGYVYVEPKSPFTTEI